MASNHVGDLFDEDRHRRQGHGLRTQRRSRDGSRRSNSPSVNGSFGWSGAFGTHFWVDRKEQLAAVLLIQEPVNAMRGDFENAVVQAIVD